MANRTTNKGFFQPSVKDRNWGNLINTNWASADWEFGKVDDHLRKLDGDVVNLQTKQHQPIVTEYGWESDKASDHKTYAWLCGDANHNFFIATPYATWNDASWAQAIIFTHDDEVVPGSTQNGAYALNIGTQTVTIPVQDWVDKMSSIATHLNYDSIPDYTYFRVMNNVSFVGGKTETPYDQSWNVYSTMVKTTSGGSAEFHPLFERDQFYYEPEYVQDAPVTGGNGEKPANGYILWTLHHGETPQEQVRNELGLLQVRAATTYHTIKNNNFTFTVTGWTQDPTAALVDAPACVIDVFRKFGASYQRLANTNYSIQQVKNQDYQITISGAANNDIVRVTHFTNFIGNDVIIPAATEDGYGSIKLGFDKNAQYNTFTSIPNDRNYAVDITRSGNATEYGHAYVHVPWVEVLKGEGIDVTTTTESAEEHAKATVKVVPATDTTLGGIKYHKTLSAAPAEASTPDGTPVTASPNYYPVDGIADGHLFVHVPWSNRNNSYISAFDVTLELGDQLRFTPYNDKGEVLSSAVRTLDLPLEQLITKIEYIEHKDPQRDPKDPETVYPYIRMYYYDDENYTEIPLDTVLTGIATETWVGSHYIHDLVVAKEATTNATVTADTNNGVRINAIRGTINSESNEREVAASILLQGTKDIEVIGGANRTLTIRHTTNATSGTYGDDRAADATLTFGGTFKVAKFTVDNYGHITGTSATRTLTLPTITGKTSDAVIVTGAGTAAVQVYHTTLSTKATTDGNTTYVSSVVTDAWGHLSSYKTQTIGTANLTLNAGSGLSATQGTFGANAKEAVSWTVSHGNTSDAASVAADPKTHKFINGLTLDDFGHVTAISTGTIGASGVLNISDANVITHNTSALKAGTYGQSANATITHAAGGTWSTLQVATDSYGHVTAANVRTNTLGALTVAGGNGVSASIKDNAISIQGVTADTNTIGVARLHTSDACTTYTSDNGGATPGAVKKAITTENDALDGIFNATTEHRGTMSKEDKSILDTISNTYLSRVEGGTMEKPLCFQGEVACPDSNGPQFLLALTRFTSGGQVQFTHVRNITSRGHLQWKQASYDPQNTTIKYEHDGNEIPTINTIAYWDGRYDDKSSNLTYCATNTTQGEGWNAATGGLIADHAWVAAYVKDYTASTGTTVNNGKLTIQKNGVQVQTFTANQSADATANITVPKIGLNGAAANDTGTFTFYAPTATGKVGQVAKYTGTTTAPTWGDITIPMIDLRSAA